MTGLISLFGTLLAMVFWIWQRSVAKRDNPINQYATARDQIAKELVGGDEVAVNVRLADALDRLSNPGSSDLSGQSSQATASGDSIHTTGPRLVGSRRADAGDTGGTQPTPDTAVH